MRPGDFDKTRKGPTRIPKMPERRMLRGFTWAAVVLSIVSLAVLIMLVAVGLLVDWALTW